MAANGSGTIRVAAAPVSWGVFEKTEGDPLQLAAGGHARPDGGRRLCRHGARTARLLRRRRPAEGAPRRAAALAGGRLPAAALQPCRACRRGPRLDDRRARAPRRGPARRGHAQGRARRRLARARAHALGRPGAAAIPRRRCPRSASGRSSTTSIGPARPAGSAASTPCCTSTPAATANRRPRSTPSSMPWTPRSWACASTPATPSSAAPTRSSCWRATATASATSTSRTATSASCSRSAAPAAVSWRPGTGASSASSGSAPPASTASSRPSGRAATRAGWSSSRTAS